MWGVTFADMVYRYRQFLIAVVGAGLVLSMGLLLAGLAGGFAAETQQTVGGVGADRWVLADNAHGRITGVSFFTQAAVAAVGAQPGVTRADPLFVLPQQVAQVGDSTVNVNLFGVRLGGLGDPTAVSAGRTLSGPGQVVADNRSGASVGQQVRIGSTHFTVVGLIADRTILGGGPIFYMDLSDAQRLAVGGRALVTAVVTTGVPARVPGGLALFTSQQVEQATLASLGSADSSINNSKALMWLIAAIIVAALLYVSALQRVRDFAVLKALGSSSSLLFLSLAIQAVVITLLAAGLAVILAQFMGGIFAQPVAIPSSAYATLPVVAVVVGLLSSLVALRRATGADPAAAFGG